MKTPPARRAAPASNNPLCQACGIKARYVDAHGATHPFCGKTCAARVSSGGPATTSPTCKIKGCKNTEDPGFQGFCSADHAKEGVSVGIVQACTRCRSLPQSSGQLCSGCAQSPSDEVRMWNMNSSGTVWREFEREWNERWSDKASTTIEKLFEISYPPIVLAEKESFRQNLRSAGDVRLLRTFHASQCICDMGTKGPTLCTWKSCGICNIVSSAFKGVAFSVPHNKGRHGQGLYSCRDSSCADRYATSCLSSPYRVMIACDVIVPRVPSRNNSILMDDLIVVQDSAAITPRYIVMYTKGK